MILALEREFSKFPGWFYTLERSQQLFLLADWDLRQEEMKKLAEGR